MKKKGQNDVEALKKELEELQKEAANKHSLYLRALADYQNLEKRVLEEKEREANRSTREIISEVLVLKEDIDKAEDFEKSHDLKVIKNKFEGVLAKLGVEEVQAEGQEFDPEVMECLTLEPGAEPNKVTRVIEKGYRFRGKLLKPARVAVGTEQGDK